MYVYVCIDVEILLSRWQYVRYSQIRGMGVRVYMSDRWNWISTFSFVTYFIGLGLQHGQTIQYYEAARIFRAVNFMSFAYQLIRYMTALEIWGILIPVLHRMVGTYSAYFSRYSATFVMSQNHQFAEYIPLTLAI